MQLNLFQQPQPDQNRLITQQRVQQINGLRLLNDYIDRRYEEELISNIDRSPWSGELKRRVQHYGYKYDYRTRRITSDAYQGPLPNWLYVLGQQLESEKLIPFLPDQAIINEYLPGQGISPHIDCEPCFGDIIISLSLSSTCSMLFEQVQSDRKRFEVLLEPRSILIMQGEARYHWVHSIPARRIDNWSVAITRTRRLSITFRKVQLLVKSTG